MDVCYNESTVVRMISQGRRGICALKSNREREPLQERSRGAVGTALWTRRIELGITQEQAAEEVGLSVRQYRNLETGRCDTTRKTAKKLLHFGVDVMHLEEPLFEDE